MDFRIRQQVAKSLIARFSGHGQGYWRQEVAFEVAFCLKIGFGVSVNDIEANMWLRRSGKQQNDLQERIRSLLTRPIVTRTPLVDSLFANGLFTDVGILHYHAVNPKHAVLKKVEAECVREITDMSKVFQSGTAYAILMLLLALPPLIRAQHDLSRAVSTAEKLIHELSDDIAYGPNDFHTLHVKTDLAAILGDMGKYTEAIDIERKVAAHLEVVLGNTHLATHMSLYSLATTLRKVRNYDEADAIDAAVLKIREEHFGPDHQETLMAVNNLGRGACERGDYRTAETLYHRVIEGLERVYGANTIKALGSKSNLATVLYMQGKHDQALQLWQPVLDHRIKKFELDHPRTLDIISNIALIQKCKGNYIAAEGLSRQVLLGRSNILGTSHPDVTTSVNNLAICLIDQRKYAEATTLLHEVIASCTTLAQADNPEFITILSYLGTAYQAEGKTKSARHYNEQALRQCRSLLNEDHPTTLVCLGNLAATYNAEGDWSKAQEAFEQVIAMKTKKWGRDSPSTLIGLSNLATVLENQDMLEASEGLRREVLAGRLKGTDSERHPTALKSFHDLARILIMRKKYMEAKEMAQKAASGRESLFGANDPLTLESKALLYFVPADYTENDAGYDDVASSDEDPE
jgi:tetratricopeptide (TPR) repeat protein